MPIIDASNLKTARKRRKWTQAGLAERLGVSKRQVAEWERRRSDGQPLSIRKKNFERLMKELQVNQDELSGESPVSDHPWAKSEKKVSLKLRISPRALMNYDLIERCYGVRFEELIEAAPLLLETLAEESLEWRAEQLADAREAGMNLFHNHGALFPQDMTNQITEVFDALEREGESISSREVFAFSCCDEGLGEGLSNRFVDFLYHLHRLPRDSEVGDVTGAFPDLPICESELRSICGEPDNPNAARAAFALYEGLVRISEIPLELRTLDTPDERAEWLAAKAPDPGAGRTYMLGEGYVPYLSTVLNPIIHAKRHL